MPKVTPLGESAKRRAAWDDRATYLKTRISELAIVAGKRRKDICGMIGISESVAFRLYHDPRSMRLETLAELRRACRQYGVPFDADMLGLAQVIRKEDTKDEDAKEALAGLQYRG